MDDRLTCATCAYFEPAGDEAICRLFPPQTGACVVPGDAVARSTVGHWSRWPRVRPDDWCGQHRPPVVPARRAPADLARGPIPEAGAGEEADG